jgi:hypothetical protein
MTKRGKICMAGMAVVLVGGLGLVHSRAQENSLDPLTVASHTSKLLLENEFVRVTEENVPPGEGQPRHTHKRGVIIALSDYTVEQKTYPAAKPVQVSRHKGEVRWSDPVDHETRNIGTTLQNVIRIELK